MASHYEAPGVKRTAEDAGLASPRDNRRPRASRSRDEILASMHEDLVQRIEELQERGLIEREGLELRALGELQQLDTRDALEVLNQYEGSDFAKVRNKTAYLLGIIHKAVKYGFNARDALMKRSVEKKLDELYSRRIIKPGDLDTRSLGALRRLDEQSALTALQQFEMHKSPDVRRPSAYFMTIVNNVKKSIGKTGHGGEAGGQPLPPPPPPPPPPPMGRQMQAGEPQLVAAAPAAVPVAALQHGRGLTTDVATLLGTLRSWVPQQAQAGVRTAELLSLSVFAGHVHPAAAAKLQELWDDGHQLVAFLDDRAWQGLTELGGPEAISVIDVVMSKLLSAPQDVRDISTFLLGVARSLKQTFGTADRDRPPGPPVLPAYGLAAAPATAPAGLQPLPQQPQPSVAGVPGQGAPSVLIIPPGSFGDAQPSAVPLPPGSNGMAHDGDASQLPPHLQPLPIEVQEKIREVVETHTPHISYDAFDRKLVDEMAKWGQREMLQVLGELQGNDLSRVKNAPAYIMGIYKRRRRETPHSSGGPR